MSTTGKSFYFTEGILHANAPSYIERSADRELLEKVQAGHICYVLSSRQMGKSSLMNRTARRLKAAKTHTAIVDLTAIGSNIETGAAEKWYFGIANKIKRDLRLKIDLNAWWEANANLTAVNRLTEFYSEVLLEKLNGPIVIFIDEIDSTIPLAFTDDFFAAIRACFQARASDERFQRLSFVLLGVATPTDLMKDPRRTPFNIGKSIDLRDFTREEALHLTAELAESDAEKKQILAWVYDWTSGHPYLTQKLCLALAQEKDREISADLVDETVQALFFSPGAAQSEHNLKFVRERLLRSGGHTATRRTLKIYRDVYQGKTVLDDPISPAHNTLKLAGVAVAGPERRLTVRNRLYREVFSDNWLGKNMPANRQLYYSLSVAALFLIALGIWYRVFLPQELLQQMAEARDDVPRRAYQDLRSYWGLTDLADEAYANYWERLARSMESDQDRDRAILYQLKAVHINDIPRRRQEVARITGKDYQYLLNTYLHNSNVRTTAFSPDGKIVLTGSDDNTARLWHSSDGTPFGKVMEHKGGIQAVAFSPDGKIVLTGSDDNTARLWHSSDGTPFGKVMEHKDDIQAVAFSPDGKIVLTGSDDNTARLWHSSDGTPFGKVMEHKGGIQAVAFSPDGKIVLTGSDDNTARLWHSSDGTPFGKVMEHKDAIQAVAFSPDGKTVLIGSADNTAQLWHIKNGTRIWQINQYKGTNPYKILGMVWEITKNHISEELKSVRGIRFVAFSPNGKAVITASNDNTARLWHSADGSPIGEIMRHNGPIQTAAFSPDGKTIITASEDNTSRLWNTSNGMPIGEAMFHNDVVRAVAFSPDGKTAITASNDNTAKLWRVQDSINIIRTMKHKGFVKDATFSPDGKMVLAASEDSTARLWHISDGEPYGQVIKHNHEVEKAAFSPDGKTILTTSADGTARLWHTSDCTPIGGAIKHDGQVQTVAFSPDGKSFITGSSNNTVRLWRVKDGTPTGKIMKQKEAIQAIAFSPDGKTVLIASEDSTARLWRTLDALPFGKTMKLDGRRITKILFSPDGKTVLTAGLFSEPKLWSTADGALISTFMGKWQFVNIAYSPDSKTVITLESRNWWRNVSSTIKLWRTSDTTSYIQPIKHNFESRAIAFSPDGNSILHITNTWLHYSSIPSDTLSSPSQFSRRAPFTISLNISSDYYMNVVNSIFYIDYSPPFHFLNPDGKQVQIIRFLNDREFFVDTVDFSQPGAPPIAGEPAALLAEWERKLGLRLNTDDGKIEPRYPASTDGRDSFRR